MQLICTLYGHRPAPLRTRRREGHCVLCQQPVQRSADRGGWLLTTDAATERATG